MKLCYLVIAAVGVMGCGIASVSPIVTDADAAYDSRLVGTWVHGNGKDSAAITAGSANTYGVVFTDEDGKTGRFAGRLGRLGPYRVLDLRPEDPIPEASDTYKSLLLLAHAIVVVDSIGDIVAIRLLEPDSLRAYPKARPRSVPHTIIGSSVLLTSSSSEEVRRFLTAFVGRRGALGEREVFRRRLPLTSQSGNTH